MIRATSVASPCATTTPNSFVTIVVPFTIGSTSTFDNPCFTSITIPSFAIPARGEDVRVVRRDVFANLSSDAYWTIGIIPVPNGYRSFSCRRGVYQQQWLILEYEAVLSKSIILVFVVLQLYSMRIRIYTSKQVKVVVVVGFLLFNLFHTFKYHGMYRRQAISSIE